MRITGVKAWQIDLPLREGRYKWSGGNFVEVFDSTVVAVETDEGITGYGEVCPLGPAYLPAYARGARTGIAELAPHIIGSDPRDLDVLDRRMNAAMRGHPYVKSAIDIACWDILGQACSLPVVTLLGAVVLSIGLNPDSRLYPRSRGALEQTAVGTDHPRRLRRFGNRDSRAEHDRQGERKRQLTRRHA